MSSFLMHFILFNFIIYQKPFFLNEIWKGSGSGWQNKWGVVERQETIMIYYYLYNIHNYVF